jgi:hypothetical protein
MERLEAIFGSSPTKLDYTRLTLQKINETIKNYSIEIKEQ